MSPWFFPLICRSSAAQTSLSWMAFVVRTSLASGCCRAQCVGFGGDTGRSIIPTLVSVIYTNCTLVGSFPPVRQAAHSADLGSPDPGPQCSLKESHLVHAGREAGAHRLQPSTSQEVFPVSWSAPSLSPCCCVSRTEKRMCGTCAGRMVNRQ